MLPWTSMEDMKSVDKTNLFVSSMFDRMKTCHWEKKIISISRSDIASKWLDMKF